MWKENNSRYIIIILFRKKNIENIDEEWVDDYTVLLGGPGSKVIVMFVLIDLK